MTHVDLGGAAAAGGSKTLRGYLATPAGEGPFAAVVMIHEAFGLNNQIRRHADRLAAAGYLTLAVDLFSDGGPRRCLVGTMKSMITGEGRVFADIAAARSWLQASPSPPAGQASSASAWAAASRCLRPTTASTPRR